VNPGALITRVTIWLALLCYVGTVVFQISTRWRVSRLTRVVWATGCVFFLVPVTAAFHFYHQWSHALAENDTRMQTIERTGLNFGAGIYFNYLLGLIWLGDCAGWPPRGKHLHELVPRGASLCTSFFCS